MHQFTYEGETWRNLSVCMGLALVCSQELLGNNQPISAFVASVSFDGYYVIWSDRQGRKVRKGKKARKVRKSHRLEFGKNCWFKISTHYLRYLLVGHDGSAVVGWWTWWCCWGAASSWRCSMRDQTAWSCSQQRSLLRLWPSRKQWTRQTDRHAWSIVMKCWPNVCHTDIVHWNLCVCVCVRVCVCICVSMHSHEAAT